MNCDDLNVREFVQMLAGSRPVPGGGAAAAVAGAIGMALGNMVGALTDGKKKYQSVQEDIQKLNARAEVIWVQLLELADQDARAFYPLSQAYRMPEQTPEQKAEKERVMEQCLEEAAQPPLQMMERCGEAIALQKEFAEKGSKLAVSDAGTGAALCRGALCGASLNVFVNTALMKNRERAEALNARANQLLERYEAMAGAVFQQVKGRL